MTDKRKSYDQWRCSFCGDNAAGPVPEQVVCDGRSCACGAIALAAPVADRDEIMGDALNLFSAPSLEQAPDHSHPLDILRTAGVEVLNGEMSQVDEGFLGQYNSTWFRKRPEQV